MKRVLKTLLLVIIGCVIGFVLGSLNSYRGLSIFADNALLEIATDAYQLQHGDSDSVLERKMRALPVLVQYHESSYRNFLSEKQWNSTLWTVSRCYEDQESGPPASIKHILDALPPRPLTSCEIKRRASEEKKTQENDSTAEP